MPQGSSNISTYSWVPEETDLISTSPLSVAVVIVTYNRKLLLKQTLKRIKEQTYPIAHIIVVDNFSTDGTREMLHELKDEPIEPLFMDHNVGGAGGFSAGIERAYYLHSDVIWVMDDDVLPELDALEHLIRSLLRLRLVGVQPKFVISNVFNSSGEPVNTPVLDLRLQASGNLRWPTFLHKGIIPILAASFVGTLFTRESIESCGLPIAEMFIWGDDIEFTSRLTEDREAGYVIGASQITHLGRGAEVSIHQETELARARNFFYFYRNNVYIMKRYGTKQRRAAFIWKLTRDLIKLLRRRELRKLFIVIQGVARGLTFKPSIRRVDSAHKLP
jgi:GT2 family glycosyltransferase